MENLTTVTQTNDTATLLEKVRVIDSVITKATELNTRANNLQLEAKEAREEADTYAAGRWIMPIVSLFICLPVGIFIAIKSWLPKNNPKTYRQKAEEKESLAAEKAAEATSLIQQHIDTLSIIPKKYWYPIATNFLVEVIETGRATTLPIAFDKLEEQLHRWNMEKGMQEQIATQMAQSEALRKIQTTSNVSAAAGVAGLFFN